MSLLEPLDDCVRFEHLTDRKAVGDPIAYEEDEWVVRHSQVCPVCRAESSFYAALPGLLASRRSSSIVGAAHSIQAPARRPKWSAWVLAAAVLSVGGIAAAGFVAVPRLRPHVLAGAAATAPSSVASPSRAPHGPAQPGPIDVASDPPATSETRAPVVIAPKAAPAHAMPSSSPSELLHKARSERAAGHVAEAAAAYRQLIRESPRAPEARAAKVSLGDLALFRLGDPAAALAAYESYLQGGPGPLTQEARYGRIRALGALGRSQEESREIERFVQDFPESPQAAILEGRRSAP